MNFHTNCTIKTSLIAILSLGYGCNRSRDSSAGLPGSEIGAGRITLQAEVKQSLDILIVRVWVHNEDKYPVRIPTKLDSRNVPTLVENSGELKLIYVWEAEWDGKYTTIQSDVDIGLTNLMPGERVELPSRDIAGMIAKDIQVIYSAFQVVPRPGVWNGEITVNLKRAKN